jgi:hypothetical protein
VRSLAVSSKPVPRAVALAANRDDLSELALGNPASQHGMLGIEAQHEPDLQIDVRRSRPLDKVRRVGRARTEWLLHKGREPALYCRQRVLGMQILRRDDEDRIQIRQRQELVVARENFGNAKVVGGPPSGRWARIAGRD